MNFKVKQKKICGEEQKSGVAKERKVLKQTFLSFAFSLVD